MSSAATLMAAVEDTRRCFERLLDGYCNATAAGDVVGETGLNLDEWMTLSAGLPTWLIRQIEDIAHRMDVLPHATALFRDGTITFDQYAAFVRTTAGLNGRALVHVDEQAAALAGTLTTTGRMHAWLGETGMLVQSLEAPGWAQRQERRREHGIHVHIQQDFDGGGLVFASLDQVSLTTVVRGLDDATPDGDEPLRHRRAHGLIALASSWLDGSGTGRTAKASIHLVIDIATATTDRFAAILREIGGETRFLSARATDLLAHNAHLLATITDGVRPLAELKPARDDAIPAAARRAVRARDKGCRFPGCTAPLRRVHVHHIVRRADGGTNDPDNLLDLCDHHHHQHVHKRGWEPTLDPTTGRVDWQRRGSPPIATMPNATRPTRPPPDRTRMPLGHDMPLPPPPTEPPPLDPHHLPDHT